jgi:hypothetical protein
MRLVASSLLLALTAQGCFALADTDDFVEDEGCDLELDLRAFAPHLGQTFEVRLVQDPLESIGESRPRLLGLAILDPLTVPNIDIDIPGMVPALTDPSRPRPNVDFYADFDENGAYSRPPSDHTWRVEDPCDPGRDPTFPHNVDFFDLPMPIGGGSSLVIEGCPDLTEGERLGGFGPFDGTEPLEVRAYGTFLPTVDGETEMDRPVALYRLGALSRATDGAIAIPAVFDNGFRYRAEIYVDVNTNGAFDPGTDRAWTYSYNPMNAPDCPARLDVCGVGMGTTNAVPICKDGTDLKVFVSRAHLVNTVEGDLTDGAWLRIPEGT